MAQEQQQQYSAATGNDARLAKYFKIIAPYQRNVEYALSDDERAELTQQLLDFLPKGHYSDEKNGKLVRLVDITSKQGDRASDFCVSCVHTDGTAYTNSVEFFIALHTFRFIDYASM